MAANANINGQLIVAPSPNANGTPVGLQVSEPPLLSTLSVAQWESWAFNIPTAGGARTINQGLMAGIKMLMVSADHPCLLFMLWNGGSTNAWSQFFCYANASLNVTGLVVTSTVDNTNVNIIIAGT